MNRCPFSFVCHAMPHSYLGLALPSRCPISKKPIKNGLFFENLETRMGSRFQGQNAKKRAKSLILSDFSPSLRYSIIQQIPLSYNQRRKLEISLGAIPRGFESRPLRHNLSENRCSATVFGICQVNRHLLLSTKSQDPAYHHARTAIRIIARESTRCSAYGRPATFPGSL